MKQNKTTGKKGEDLNLETLPTSSLFSEVPTVPPIQSASYSGDELEESLEEFELQAEEGIGTEEKEEVQAEQHVHEEVPFHPPDITLEYLKSLEKISLLTPEQEVELAKRIKEGERQVKTLGIRANRLKAKLYPPFIPKNGNKRLHSGTLQGHKTKGKNGKKLKFTSAEKREQTLLYKKLLNRYQQAVLETQQAKNELIQANLRLVVSIAKR